MTEERDEETIAAVLAFSDQTLDWLEHHHAQYGQQTEHDLAEANRVNAIWKLSGESLSHARALISLLREGYAGQAWPTMRAIHESNQLLGAVADLDEAEIGERWLADQEIQQREVRAAAQRQAERLAEQMKEAGLEPLTTNVDELAATVYRGMSKAAHHQRSAVDEAVDSEARVMVYGRDPKSSRRLEFVIFSAALIQEVLLKLGDALSVLYGPPFYADHLAPVVRRFQEMMDKLDVIDTANRLGL